MNGTAIRTTLVICLVFAASVANASVATGTYAPSTAPSDSLGYRALALTPAIAPGAPTTFKPTYNLKTVIQLTVRHSTRQLVRKSSLLR